MGECGEGIVPCWIKYPVQQRVSFVNAGSTQFPDEYQERIMNTILGLPFSVAAWESDKAHFFSRQETGK